MKFCRHCGSSLKTLTTQNGYDENTGKPMFVSFTRCENPLCVSGCPNAGGHLRPRFFSRPVCRRCGQWLGSMET